MCADSAAPLGGHEDASAGFFDVPCVRLAGGLPFGRIAEVIDAVLQQHAQGPATDLEAVRAADRAARARATTFLD